MAAFPRPVFVILSSKPDHAPWRSTSRRLGLTSFPALKLYELGADGTFVTQRKPSFDATPLLRLGDSVRPLVSGFATRFKATANPIAGILVSRNVRWRPVAGATTQPNSASCPGRLLQLQQQDPSSESGGSGIDLKDAGQASARAVFCSRPQYIVVENSAQWRMLELSETAEARPEHRPKLPRDARTAGADRRARFRPVVLVASPAAEKTRPVQRSLIVFGHHLENSDYGRGGKRLRLPSREHDLGRAALSGHTGHPRKTISVMARCLCDKCAPDRAGRFPAAPVIRISR